LLFSLRERAEIKKICEEKLQQFIVDRGLSIWDYRLFDDTVAPDSLWYRVIQEAKGRRALCGATKDERPLHLDHIKPRSKGGKTEYENLQALCSKCNTIKGNKDDKDFRHIVEGVLAATKLHS
jgi:hypothetical protein